MLTYILKILSLVFISYPQRHQLKQFCLRCLFLNYFFSFFKRICSSHACFGKCIMSVQGREVQQQQVLAYHCNSNIYAMKFLLELFTKGRAVHVNKTSHKNTSYIQSLEGEGVRFAFSQVSRNKTHWANFSPVTN